MDHSTVHRLAMKLLPVLDKALRCHKRTVGKMGLSNVSHINWISKS